MATCSIDDLISDACANGFYALGAKQADAVALELLNQITGTNQNAGQIDAAACASGLAQAAFDCKMTQALTLQLLCNASS